MSKKRNKIKQDSMFKNKVSVMPEGYYSGDQPNPHLREFVENHLLEKPYDPEIDAYEVPHFIKPIHIKNRRSAVNDLHIYWSKKPHAAVQSYINHYTTPGDLVLDPFAGSGGTILCSLINGCSAIGIDLSPAATFLVNYYCTPVDIIEFESAFNEIMNEVKPTFNWLYEARTNDGSKAKVAYFVWSQVFQCDRCLSMVPIAHCVEVPAFGKDGNPQYNRKGEQAARLACPECFSKGNTSIISTGSKRWGRVPIKASCFIEQETKKQRFEKKFSFSNEIYHGKKSISLESMVNACYSQTDSFELIRLIEIRDNSIPFQYPTNRMMNIPNNEVKWGVLWRKGVADFTNINEVFEKRALWALAAYYNAINSIDCSQEVKNALLGVYSSSLWNCSRMYRERKTGGGPQEGVYYLPPLSREVNVATVLLGKKKTFIKANSEIGSRIKTTDLCISTQSATKLNVIPNNSVDYIFTDPPYSWKVPYGELNFLWEAFLGFNTSWHEEEIIISDTRGINEQEWGNRLFQAFKECYRVLKPGRCMTLCYHDTSEGTWETIQDILSECGFIPEMSDHALSIGTGQKSLKQLTANKITQRDLVINFRKPRPDELFAPLIIIDTDDEKTFRGKVHAIVREYLSDHPGSSQDRIYDEVVSRMVRRGQMEAHNFDELLQQVAEEIREPIKKNLFEYESPDLFRTHEIGRWYLKESEMDVADEAETMREDNAASSVSGFMGRWLEKNSQKEGVHYSDIFEHYIYAVKDKPRRRLQDWLPDYFYKTTEGTYRLPANQEEEEAKAKGRLAGINRRIKRYVAYLTQGVPVPEKERPGDATLAEWIRQCKLTGLYQEGKILFEKGGLDMNHLSEEAQVNVEEDYQVCLRLLSRGEAMIKEKKPKK